MDNVEPQSRCRTAGDQLFWSRAPISESLSDRLVLGLLFRGPVSLLAALLVHRFFLRCLGSVGAGASKAVITYTCGNSSSTTSKITAKCLPVEVDPYTAGRPLVRLATAAS